MTEKRFECDKGSRIIIDNETKLHYIMTLDWECSLVTKLLNHFAEENEQLKQSVNNLKDTIIKITIAYQRKYDRTIVDLVDEVHDEDITDLIKELQE